MHTTTVIGIPMAHRSHGRDHDGGGGHKAAAASPEMEQRKRFNNCSFCAWREKGNHTTAAAVACEYTAAQTHAQCHRHAATTV